MRWTEHPGRMDHGHTILVGSFAAVDHFSEVFVERTFDCVSG